jgi:hypothetical protein
MGLSPTEVIEGYEIAAEKALDILPSKDVLGSDSGRIVGYL